MARTFDYILVGGGAAGCLLAARLSSRSANEVLLIEAGPDFEPGHEPATIRDLFPRSTAVDAFKWPDQMTKARIDRDDRWRLDQGRVMGGCTSIMGMVALRGFPEDYDEWAQFGLPDWSWADVLPAFRRIETDTDFDGPLHGRDGAIDIRRYPPEAWPPLCRALAGIASDQPGVADMNGEFRDGVGWLPRSTTADARVSAASAFLTREVRSRPNLTIMAEATVLGLERDGRTITGVRFRHRGVVRTAAAREVILSAGSLRSPALLQRAGIGDAAALAALGITPIVDRPGVGRELQNHPALYIAALLKPAGRQPRHLQPWAMNAQRYTSGLEGTPPSDMLMFFINKSSWHAIGRRIGSIGASVYKSYSRGSVELIRKDGDLVADVSLGLLSDARDLDRLTDGVRRAYALWQHPDIARLRWQIIAAPSGDLVRRLHRPSLANAALARLAAVATDCIPAFRPIAAALAGSDISAIVDDPEALREWVYRKAVPLCHFVGSCRMGTADDPRAVTDGTGKVFGVDGLRVVDGSILPTVPRANTNIPVTMVAEKVATMLLARDAR